MQLATSYIHHDGKCFLVSTVVRDSSAMDGPRQYAETIAWEMDMATKQRGAQVAQTDDVSWSIAAHLTVCSALFERGEY